MDGSGKLGRSLYLQVYPSRPGHTRSRHTAERPKRKIPTHSLIWRPEPRNVTRLDLYSQQKARRQSPPRSAHSGYTPESSRHFQRACSTVGNVRYDFCTAHDGCAHFEGSDAAQQSGLRLARSNDDVSTIPNKDIATFAPARWPSDGLGRIARRSSTGERASTWIGKVFRSCSRKSQRHRSARSASTWELL